MRLEARGFVEKNFIDQSIQDATFNNLEIKFKEDDRIMLEELLRRIRPIIPNILRSSAGLTKFCNEVDYVISDITPTHLNTQEKVGIIRNRIRKELLYKIYKNVFDQLRGDIDQENPEIVTPAWIEEHFKSHRFLRNGFRTIDNEVDWVFIAEKLGVTGRFKSVSRFKEKEYVENDFTFDSAIETLRDLLETFQPLKFTSECIQENNENLYNYFKNNIKTTDGNSIDWDRIIGKLNLEYKNKWSHDNSDNGREMEAEILHEETLLDFRETDLEQRFIRTIERLHTLLRKKQPASFGPRFIEKNDKTLYNYFQTHVRSEDGIDWKLIVNSLDLEWRGKWKRKQREKGKIMNFEEAIVRLNLLLQTKNPKKFGPYFICDRDRRLYDFLLGKIRDSDSGILDWKLIINSIDSVFQSRFVYPKRPEYYFPKEYYRDSHEVDTAMEKYQDKIYTFYELLEKGDLQVRNNICADLIRLARKGNSEAEERLSQYMMVLIDEWMEKSNSLYIYAYKRGFAQEVLRNCIYYDTSLKKFPSYVYTSLKLWARTFQTDYTSLDAPIQNKGGESGPNLYNNLYGEKMI